MVLEDRRIPQPASTEKLNPMFLDPQQLLLAEYALTMGHEISFLYQLQHDS